MKKRSLDTPKIFTLAISFIIALVIVYSGFIDTLIAFLLVGAIPGTSLNVPPTIMLAACIALTWIYIFRLSIIKLTESLLKQRHRLKHAARKGRLPRRRYSRV